MDKARIVQALAEDVEKRLRLLQDSVAHTVASATHDEARSEDQYDTRALELTYLAAGQNERIAALREALTHLHFYTPPPPAETVGPGALVEADDGERSALFFLSPFGYALKLAIDGQEVQVLTPGAPLGQALLGQRAGDVVKVALQGKTRELEIVGVM